MICTSKHASFAVGMIFFAATCMAADPQEGESAARTLDLKAPLITMIFTAQQIEMLLAQTFDPDLERVEVEAARIDLPLTDKSAAPVEAAFLEVVRWLAPYPATIAARVNTAPDSTDPYRPAPLMLSSYNAAFPPPYSQR